MKDLKNNQRKERNIAIGFTVAIHAVAITGLIFLGLSRPPEPPKQIKMVLVKPEDIIPPEPKPEPIIESADTVTTDQNFSEVNKQAETAPPPPSQPTPKPVDVQKAMNDAKQAEAIEKQAAEDAKQLQQNQLAQEKAAKEAQAAKDKAAKDKAARDKAAQEKAAKNAQAAKDKAARDKAAQEKAAKEAQAAKDKAAKDKAIREKAAQEKLAKEAQAAKDKAARDKAAQEKAAKEAQAAKDKAARDKAAQDKAAKEAQAAKDKAARDKAAQEKAAKEAQAAKDKAARDAAIAKEAQEAKDRESAANKQAEVKRVADNAVRDFKNKVSAVWDPPIGKTGEKATVSVTLDASGHVKTVSVTASDPAVKASAEKAVRSAAPYPMPSDPQARIRAQSFKTVLTVK